MERSLVREFFFKKSNILRLFSRHKKWARRTWIFGKKIGLSGNDEAMIKGLIDIEKQVSNRDPCGKEYSVDDFNEDTIL